MGDPITTTLLLSTLLSTGTQAAAGQKARSRTRLAEQETKEATEKLEEEQKVTKGQATQKILKGRRAQGVNAPRETILTGGLGLGGSSQTGKTLLGE